MTTTPELRLHLFGGKGGVGKTTCAASFAASAALTARRGETVLVASTDPAHSLGDALGLELDGEPRVVPGLASLSAVEIDAGGAWERWLVPRRAILAAIAERGTYFTREDLAPILELPIPGVDELFGLLEVLRLADLAAAQRVVVDAAPTGHTLRLLEMPQSLDAFATVLDALEERHRVLAGVFGSRTAPGEMGAGTEPGQQAEALIADLRRDARNLYRRLRDKEKTHISWVLLPEPLAIAETESALRRLSDSGLGVSELIVNRVAQASNACAESLGRLDAEASALREVQRRFPGRALRQVAERQREPTGVRELLSIAGHLAGHEVLPAAKDASPRQSSPVRSSRALPTAGPAPDVTGQARLILIGGKGGVGKSTCAAALAIALASDAVDLVSTDPAPSLAHLFGFDESPTSPIRPTGGPEHLRVQELDAARRFESLRERLLVQLDRFARRGDDRRGGSLPLERSVFESLVAATPPGLDELVALGDLAERLERPTTRIVVDLAPTGHALRLLELPELVQQWLRALMKLLLTYRQALGLGDLAQELLAMSKSVRRVQELLRDPERCVFVAVTRAAALPTAETLRLLGRLDRLGVASPAVVVNAVLPPSQGGPCDVQRDLQDGWIRQTAEAAGRRAILLAPLRFPRPAGVQSLTKWHDAWTALGTPEPSAETSQRPQGEPPSRRR